MMKDWTRAQWRIPLKSVIVFWLKVLRASGCFPYAIDVIEIDERSHVQHEICGKNGTISLIKLTAYKHKWLNTLLLLSLASFNIVASLAEFKTNQDLFTGYMTNTEITTVTILPIVRNVVYLSVVLHAWWNSSILQTLIQLTVEVLNSDKKLRFLRSAGHITQLFFPLLVVDLFILVYTQSRVGRDILHEKFWESGAPIVWGIGIVQYLLFFNVYFSLICINNACQSILVHSFEQISRSIEIKVDFYSQKLCAVATKLNPSIDHECHASSSFPSPKSSKKSVEINGNDFLKQDKKEHLLAPQLTSKMSSTALLNNKYSVIDLPHLQRLWQIQNKINSFFWFSTLIYSAAYVLFSAGIGFLTVVMGQTASQNLSSILFFIIQSMPLGLLYHTADQLHENKNRLLQELARFQLFADDSTEADQARRLMEFVHVQPEVTAGGFFSLSKAKLLAMMGFISSYLVILLQFNGKTNFLTDRFAGLNQSAMQGE
ncbi:Gustatory receptor 21 [Hyalella azteca]|uniref:Gustatory receptor 21 n=1 Tax=Hyalella azteca TaxID=294128 RepID=A0A6A0HCZ1_HYAAZ|nr:Gustatory receptor 21 [Hyalella azteca]